ncbi:Autophagy protein 22 [Actinomortierella wolfii]|nr:Autophagy protein 22 [Actinomortierella wolfii]
MTTTTTASKDELTNLLPTADQIQSLSVTTINVSHYNEKVRWALDYYQVPHTEFRTLPLLHVLTMFSKRYRKGTPPGGGTPFITPHLDIHLKTGNTIPLINSSTINKFLSSVFSSSEKPSLYAHGNNVGNGSGGNSDDHRAAHQKIVELEERLDNVLGVHVRRFLYGELLLYAPRSVFGELASHDGYGRLQRWLWRLFHPLIRLTLINVFKVTPENVLKSRDILEKEFEYFSQLLSELSSPISSAYLVGDRFSAADLALAALGCMVIGISQEDGYGAWVPPSEKLRPEAVEWGNKMRETPAGQHIIRCYSQHRGQKAPGSSYGFSVLGTDIESIDNEPKPKVQDVSSLSSTPPQYNVPELKRTEAWAWVSKSGVLYMQNISACGYGWTTTVVLIPVLVQDLAAQAGVQANNHALPCDPAMKTRCVTWFVGAWLDPGTIALYVASLSSIVAFFISLSVAAIADHGNYKKPLLILFSMLGFAASLSFMSLTRPSLFWVAAILAPLGWSSYTVVTILGTSYLCVYARAHPRVQALIREIESTSQPVEQTDGTVVPAQWSMETKARVRKEEEQASNDLSGWCSVWANVGSCCVMGVCIGLSLGMHQSILSLKLATVFTGVWWILWTLGCLRWLEPRVGPPLPKGEFWLLYSWKKNLHTIKNARKLSQLSIFLLAWFMLSDAGNTITSVLFVVAYEDLHFSHIESLVMQLLMSVTAGIGAWIFLFIRQRWRLSTKTMIFWMLGMYVLINLYFVIPDLFSAPFGLRHGAEAWFAVCYTGLIISTFFGCLRVMMAELCPMGEENEYLGLFLLCDKGSSWIGPLVTGAISSSAGGQYIKGFWFPLSLFIVGAILLSMVDMRKGKDEAERFAAEKMEHTRILQMAHLQARKNADGFS